MSEELENEIAKFLKIRDDKGNNLLHYVVKSDNVEFAKHLIAAGCDVNAKNNNGEPPLVSAIKGNKLKMVKILLNAGANCENCYAETKLNALHIAAWYGCPEIVQLFIELGADVNARTKDLQTPLHYAISSKSEQKSEDYCKVMKMLIEAGAMINAMDGIGRTPLLITLEFEFCEGFELLVKMGADLCIEGNMNFMLLYETVERDNLHLFKRLIELGFDINMTDELGSSILHEAASWSSIKILEFLLDEGALTNVINNRGFDPLSYIIDDWSDAYNDLNYKTDDLYRCLKERKHREMLVQHLKVLDLLLIHGANVNRVTNDGLTPLDIVLENYDYMPSNFARILLKYGAKFDFDHPLVTRVMSSSNKSKFPHLLLKHTAMFEAQNRTDGPLNFNLNNLDEESRKDYARCRDELELMKSTKVDNTIVSFFDILVKKDIGPYTRNESIRNVFEAANFSKTFPIYSDILCERFTKELESQNLVQEATNGLGYVLNWDCDSMQLPLSKVLRYLDKTDLTNLALI